MKEPQQPIYQRLRYLRRRYRPNLRLVHGPLNSVSLVNVTLLVLLFFVVNSAFVLQPAIPLQLPAVPFVAGTRSGDLVVAISQNGLIFFNDERTTLEGLAPALVRQARARPEATLLIQADRRVDYGTLAAVYRMAVAAGIQEVAIATSIETATGGNAP